MSVDAYNKKLCNIRRKHLGLLSDWYGIDFAETEVAAHISQPIAVSKAISELQAQFETTEISFLRKIRESWASVAGGGFAQLTEPLKIQDGILFLEVRHSALLRELKSSVELIKESINSKFPEIECKEIQLVISGGGRRLNRK